jgi:hypothetical protein
VDFVCLYFSNWINSLGEQSLNLYSKVYSFSTVKKLYLIHWLQSCPQLPRILEIVGLGYTIWFSSRYLLFKVCPYLLLSNDTRDCSLRKFGYTICPQHSIVLLCALLCLTSHRVLNCLSLAGKQGWTVCQSLWSQTENYWIRWCMIWCAYGRASVHFSLPL